MRKTYYQNFLPTKADEEVATASKTPLQTARLLVEIRDMNPPPVIDPFHPWQIKKVVTDADVLTGKLSLSHHDVFEYVFRYWNLEMCNYVLAGNKFMPVIWDHTDEKNPVRYHKEELCIELGPWDTFVLGWLDLVRKSNINPRDEIGLYWQSRSGTLQFKNIARLVQVGFTRKPFAISGTMKEAYYYGFLPSKAEEEAAKASNTPFQTTREVVKIRDLRLAPFNSPWQIQKVVTDADVLAGKLAGMQLRGGGTQVQPCDMGSQQCDLVVLAKQIRDFTL